MLSQQSTLEFGLNFEEKNLRRIIQFAQLFPEPENVATLWRHLSRSHLKLLLPGKAGLKNTSCRGLLKYLIRI